jgi:phage terminase large subunit
MNAVAAIEKPVFDWKNPDYKSILVERSRRLERLRAMSHNDLAAVKAFYRDHPVEFINDWGMTSDPRNVEIGLPVNVPFLLFPKQAEFVEWVYAKWRNREDGLAEKSRDMGVSWLCVAIAVHMWLFFPNMQIGFGSRKEEYVDEIGNLKALFPKMRLFVDLLPKEFRPKGWNGGKYMLIINPENSASIIGEAGDNIGRGARTGIYFKDESAFYERSEKIEAALSQTSNCKIDVSTPNGSGNSFYRKRHGGKIDVFSFHWKDDPRKDQAWYEKQKVDLDPVILAQEVDIDYSASVSNAWIEGSLFEDAFGKGPADVEAIGPKVLGVDASHEGDDNSCVTFRRGRVSPWTKIRKGRIDGPDLAGWVIEEVDQLGGVDCIVIELDGPGVSCYDTLKRSKHASVTVGVHTGARRADGQNYNLRAKMWRGLREWLKDDPCSIKRDGELKAEASAMRYGYKDGLLLMEDKKQYKKRVGKSPDRADSLALTFAVDAMPKREQGDVSIPRLAMRR